MNHILTAGGIHMVINGKPVTVAKSDKYFAEVVDALKRKATGEEILDILEAEKRKMEQAVEVAPGIEMKGGQLYYNGETIAGVLGERMLQMVDEGFDLTPMVAFLTNLMENPAKRVVDHLYAFLDHGKNPITEDGCFLAYKAVREDFKDIHSGNFDNSVGQVLSMPRNRVDEDPNNTCSYGFHVCSFDYLPHFANANGHVMVCKVNPADVVAIPRDYNNTKMRVCKYEVISEYEDYYGKKEDTLANTSVATTAGRTFLVQVDRDGMSSWEDESDFDRLADAAERMETLLEDSSVASVRIRNIVTGAVIDEQDNDDFDDSGVDSGEGDLTYDIVGIRNGQTSVLESDFDDASDAMREAIDYDGYDEIRIVDSNGTVVKTIV